MKVYVIQCIQHNNINTKVDAVVDSEDKAKEYCEKMNLCKEETDTYKIHELNYFYKEFILNDIEPIKKYKITIEEYDLYNEKDIVITYSCYNGNNIINEVQIDPFGYLVINLYVDENKIYNLDKKNLKNIMKKLIDKKEGGESLEKINDFIKNLKI